MRKCFTGKVEPGCGNCGAATGCVATWPIATVKGSDHGQVQ